MSLKIGMRAGETSDSKPSKLHFLSSLMAEKNNVGQNFLNKLRRNIARIFVLLFNDVISIGTIQRRMMSSLRKNL
jgi:hypothetical protein